MGAVDHSLTAHDMLQLRCYELLSICIKVARRLIKEENLSVWLEQATRYQHSLPLTTR
jgi:hypothetical protein